jgi:hypothetical protein
MLTYLDSLCDALVARDLPRLHHLVDDHPLARLLPPEAQAEVRRFLTGKVFVHAVPLAMFRFRDQTARLLSEAPRVADPIVPAELAGAPAGAPAATSATRGAPASARRKGRRTAHQMELPLSA